MLVNNEMGATPTEGVDVKKTFLYVGNALSKTKKCLSLYNESFISKNLHSAKEFLNENLTANKHLPDLIILDIPYNNRELSEFTFWLKDTFDTNIPVIYNESSIQA